MSFQEKNITVSLVNFTLIFLFFSIRIWQLWQNGNFVPETVFRLWTIVIITAVFVTIFATILTHIAIAFIQTIQAGGEQQEVEDRKDERDELIDLRGTRITYTISSLGSFFAMLTFAFGQPPLVMFTLLIFFGVLAQIVGDARRLMLYRRGF